MPYKMSLKSGVGVNGILDVKKQTGANEQIPSPFPKKVLR